jgi:hypothetical protein
MKHLITAILATTVFAATAGLAPAQADAQQAYQQAKAAYQATPISPTSGPATGSSNGHQPKSKFLAV